VKRTALRRIDRPRLLRNVAVALGNTGDAAALAPLVALLANPAPQVRGHAAWGLGALAAAVPAIAAAAGAALTAAAAAETDADVQDELAAARAYSPSVMT
jgi:epoxyqueuosine reductase